MKTYIYVAHPTEEGKLFRWDDHHGFEDQNSAISYYFSKSQPNSEEKASAELKRLQLIRLPDYIYPPDELMTRTGWARRQPRQCAAYIDGLCLKPVVLGAIFCSDHIVPTETAK